MPLPDFSAVHAYIQAWSAQSLAEAEDLLRSCWREDSEIVGPGYKFVGWSQVLAEVQRFREQRPGWKAIATTDLDGHGCWVRFKIAMVSPTGELAHEGWDVIELAKDNRIRRVITFWGPLSEKSKTP